MSGKTKLSELLSQMNPQLNEENYIFVSISEDYAIKLSDVISLVKEKEETTLILRKNKANELQLPYEYIALWITLNVYSSLEAVGLTAAVSNALTKNNISCNVLTAYYHDHLFVDRKMLQLL